MASFPYVLAGSHEGESFRDLVARKQGDHDPDNADRNEAAREHDEDPAVPAVPAGQYPR